MAVTLLLQQISVPPGQRLLIHNLDWAEFESLLADHIVDRRHIPVIFIIDPAKNIG